MLATESFHEALRRQAAAEEAEKTLTPERQRQANIKSYPLSNLDDEAGLQDAALTAQARALEHWRSQGAEQWNSPRQISPALGKPPKSRSRSGTERSGPLAGLANCFGGVQKDQRGNVHGLKSTKPRATQSPPRSSTTSSKKLPSLPFSARPVAAVNGSASSPLPHIELPGKPQAGSALGPSYSAHTLPTADAGIRDNSKPGQTVGPDYSFTTVNSSFSTQARVPSRSMTPHRLRALADTMKGFLTGSSSRPATPSHKVRCLSYMYITVYLYACHQVQPAHRLPSLAEAAWPCSTPRPALSVQHL